MYFLLIRPQQRRQREPAALQQAIEVGDEVMTTSGLYGFVTGFDGDIAWLEIDDNVQIRVARQAIQRKVDTAKGETAMPSRRRHAGQADQDRRRRTDRHHVQRRVLTTAMRRKLIVSLVGIMVVAFGAFLAHAHHRQQARARPRPAGRHLGHPAARGRHRVQRREPRPGRREDPRARRRLGVAEPEILRQGDTIVVNLPGVQNQQQAVELVQVTGQVYLRPVLSQCQVLDDERPPPRPRRRQRHHRAGTTVAGTTTPATPHRGPAARRVPSARAPPPRRRPTTSAAAARPPRHHAASHHDAAVDHGARPTTTAAAARRERHPDPGERPDQHRSSCRLQVGPAAVLLVGPQQGTGEVFDDNASAAIIPDERLGCHGRPARRRRRRRHLEQPRRAVLQPDGDLPHAARSPSSSTARCSRSPRCRRARRSTAASRSAARSPRARPRTSPACSNSGSLPVQLRDCSRCRTCRPRSARTRCAPPSISGLVGVLLVLLFMVVYYRLLGLIVAVGITVVAAPAVERHHLAVEDAGPRPVAVRHRRHHRVGRRHRRLLRGVLRATEGRSARPARRCATARSAASRRLAHHRHRRPGVAHRRLRAVVPHRRRGARLRLLPRPVHACDLLVAYFFTRPMVLLLARTKWMERRKVMGIEVASARSIVMTDTHRHRRSARPPAAAAARRGPRRSAVPRRDRHRLLRHALDRPRHLGACCC